MQTNQSQVKVLGKGKCDFYRCWKEREALQAQGEPTGSREVKKFQLLDNVEDKIVRDLRLTSYNSAEDIFRVLKNRFGNRTTIAFEIVKELQNLAPIRSQKSRRIIELIQAVENTLNDLWSWQYWGHKEALNVQIVWKQTPWCFGEGVAYCMYAVDVTNNVELENRVDSLLKLPQEPREYLRAAATAKRWINEPEGDQVRAKTGQDQTKSSNSLPACGLRASMWILPMQEVQVHEAHSERRGGGVTWSMQKMPWNTQKELGMHSCLPL